MRRIVLDTNCLLMCIPKVSPYRLLWDCFLRGSVRLCVTTEILDEYLEILTQKVGSRIANNIIELLINSKHVEFYSPTYRFHIIKTDEDDNKFVDCAVVAGASCIVSNDAHFREVENTNFPKVWVFCIADFVKILKRQQESLPS